MRFDDHKLIRLDTELHLDLHLHKIVKEGGFKLPLTATQARLLECLAQDLGHPVSAEDLLLYTWGEDGIAGNRDLYNCVNKIRKHLENDHRNPRYLISIHGYGYMLYPHMSDP